MKKALLKDSVKEIRKTYKRFLSILLMSLLGVGFFAGIRATSPDMRKTIDNYYNEQNFYDIQMISTLGLTDEDVDLIKNNEYVSEVYGSFSKEALVEISNNSEPVVKVHSLLDINKVILKEGRLPEKDNECVVEQGFLAQTAKKIGDTITLEDSDDSFNNDTLTIVGTVESPLYITRDRGSGTLGTGKIDYYIYTNSENFNLDVYTELYIKIKNENSYATTSDEYSELVDNALNSIKVYEEQINTRRYDELIKEANDKVDEAQQELDKNKQENEQKLNDAQKEIDDYRLQIEDSKVSINSQKNNLDTMFADYDKQIQDGKVQLENAQKTLDEQRVTAQEQINNALNTKTTLEENLSKVEMGITIATDKNNQIFNILENPGNLSEEEINYLKGLKVELEAEIESLNQNKGELEESIYLIDNTVNQINQELEDAQTTIDDQKIALTQRENEINSYKEEAYGLIDDYLVQIDNSERELNENQIELDKNREEFNNQIKEAEDEIIDAREEVENIEHPKLYTLSREDNTGFNGFKQDTQSIENIGRVFPILFFVIATLISLNSMTRMVEEQRQQIGTLKALGYTKLQISFKYILYAALATVIGGILGMSIGFYLIPKIIWMMYQMMYTIPNFVVEFNFEAGALGLWFAIICIVGATIYTCYKELREKPAILMRPKAPKLGKRVLLEKIPFIWNRFNFTTKVTIRNMFRYKKRFLMTIIGILGCTALILAGFGLKDSITSVIGNQYGEVFRYNYMIGVKSSLSDDEITEFNNEILKRDDVDLSVKTYLSTTTITSGELSEDVQIMITDKKEDLYSIVNLTDLDGNKVELNDNTIYLTDKLAQLLDVNEGDTVTLENTDGELVEIKVGKIVRNYVYHYAYMSKDLYNNLIGEYSTNMLIVKNNDFGLNNLDNFSRDIMSDNRVSSLTDIETMKSMISDMMESLNYVVWVLIVSSGLLAFVVLYNLANVNISERIRELATIKVLGFYDNEVYNYISKETTILTFMGIVIGLFGGVALTSFILKTCEINVLRFVTLIHPISYVYAALITILFTLIVNFVTYFALKKINMIESLKSVE